MNLKDLFLSIKSEYLITKEELNNINKQLQLQHEQDKIEVDNDNEIDNEVVNEEKKNIEDVDGENHVGNKRKYENLSSMIGKGDENSKGVTTNIPLKKRHQDNRPKNEDRICPYILKEENCPYLNSIKPCTYNHNVMDYLNRKPDDLICLPINTPLPTQDKPLDITACYLYNTYGECPYSIMCRFGKGHIDYINGINIKKNIIIKKKQYNILLKNIQNILRKKNYDKYYNELYNIKINNRNNEKKIKAEEAEDKPEEAEVKPEEAEVKPEEAEVKPEETEDKPEESEVKPEETEVKPEEAEVKPEETEESKKLKLYNQNTSTIFNDKEKKKLDFRGKIYIAPLTTVGNLPFRRILKEFDADITCGEMALTNNIEQGQSSEWALMRRYDTENEFGVQIAGSNPQQILRTTKLIQNEIQCDFIDFNSACPIDTLCNKGGGSALMNKPSRLCEIINLLTKQMNFIPYKSSSFSSDSLFSSPSSITMKIRIGWDEKNPTAHKLIPQLQTVSNNRLSAVMIHGRSRLQRYHKLANWNYVLDCARSQDFEKDTISIIGNGDILTWQDWESHKDMLSSNLTSRIPFSNKDIIPKYDTSSSILYYKNQPYNVINEFSNNLNQYITRYDDNGLENIYSDNDQEVLGLINTPMLARGALIKPWLPLEIKSQKTIDLSASQRFDILKKFCNYGLEHWGSDNQGIMTTRRFLLEWMSFTHRYIPSGCLEEPQKMHLRPPYPAPLSSYSSTSSTTPLSSSFYSSSSTLPYLTYARKRQDGDLEYLLSSPHASDWLVLAQRLLGPLPDGFTFIPKHKSNSYSPETDAFIQA